MNYLQNTVIRTIPILWLNELPVSPLLQKVVSEAGIASLTENLD